MPDIKFPKFYEPFADNFFEQYQLENEVTCPSEKVHGLKNKKLRTCKFCGKSFPQTTFKKDAHIIPEALGNRYMVSDFECDNCNEIFGHYENELVKYLGISRTITKTKTKSKIPNYNRPHIKASIEKFFNTDSIIIESKTEDFKVFDYNPETNERIIRSIKAPYVPIKVFKALMKMGLCLVNNGDLKNYNLALKFLKTNIYDTNIKMPLYLSTFILPSMYEKPFGILFKRNSIDFETPTHVFVLFYKSYQFQICLPFNNQDENLMHVNCPILPPVFDGLGNENFKYLNHYFKNLNDGEVVKGEEEFINFKIDQGSLKNVVAFDPKTKIFSDAKLEEREIKKIIIIDKNLKLSLDDLSKLK
ncbi:MAG: HNH endonuclease [Parafilimonas sp.]